MWTVIFLTLSVWAQQTYIKLGEATIEKSTLAIPEPVYLGNAQAGSSFIKVRSEIWDVLLRDLSVVGYFNIYPVSKLDEIDPSSGLMPKEIEKNGFDFAEYKKAKVDFIVKVGFRIDKNTLIIESYSYQVAQASTILAHRYQGDLSSLREMVHKLADDFVTKISGKPTFLTKKLAVLIQKPKEVHKELYIMDWDGENRKKITDHKTILLSPAWSKDGRKIAYTAFMQRKSSKVRNADLFIYDLDRQKSELISFRKGINSGACFEPNGTLLITISTDADPDIYRIDMKGNIIKKLTHGPLGALNVEPAVSPDGKWIAFSSDRAGRPMIYISNAEGEDVRRLTFAGTFNAAPTWAPDSKTLAFAGWIDKAFDIYTIDRDGQQIKRITKAFKKDGKQASHENPDFSPDGRVIIYTSNRTGKSQLYMSLSDGSEEWAITQDQLNYYQPRWSP
ncbi:MAG: translocation protein TolB [Bdellovibrionaceae bacterium]|nr:translocation protein TolB [Pseudobdellovibrionaceae bacterium]MDW8190836.1 translocation protein TolB [Pseudobdellovibrionaceae bacterium]